MKKLLSLIKTCMSDNMSLFKIKSKNSKTKKLLPLVLTILIFFVVWSYANMIMEQLIKVKLEFVLLTLFVFFTFILTLVEGIYKSSSLLFNCKDDDLLLSLPLERRTVLFIRIFKFYVFELLYNSIVLLPAMLVYIRYVNVSSTYYIVSLVMLLLLPIIPIVLSCLIGTFVASSSSKFSFKNLAQILITTILLLAVLYLSYNLETIITNLAKNAASINEIITKLYYPAGVYNKLIDYFNIFDLLVFIFVNIGLFAILVFILSKVYFNINSRVKTVKAIKTKEKYKIKENKIINSLIKKELKKFVTSPVFVTNAGFGLVLFVIACISICFKFDNISSVLIKSGLSISKGQLNSYIPVVLFGLICFASLMSSITCSMISLEGKSFNILKSLPVKPFIIILSKVYTAVLIMIPFILIGDLIVFIKFKFNILNILIILVASFVLPLISEIIGIIVNLKYPKMDAENDTEVVKQSSSSLIAVFIGIIYTSLTCYLLVLGIEHNIAISCLLLIVTLINTIILISLLIYLSKFGTKDFNKINE